MLKMPMRIILMTIALLSLSLGILGIFIPGLPTTVFILIAAWAASHSSPKMANWLESHRFMGPIICNWRNGGFVSRKTKKSATVSMLFCALIIWLLNVNIWIIVVSNSCMLLVLIWLWLRPESSTN